MITHSNKNNGQRIRNASVTKGIFQDLSHHFMQLAPDVFYLYDIEKNRFTWVNHNLNGLLGYEAHNEKVCTPAFIGITHPDDQARVIAFIESWNEIKGGIIREMEYRITDGDDEVRWINHKCRVVKRDESGLAWRLSGIIADITEQKRIEEKLHENEMLLMEKNRILRELNYELAIEIREHQKTEKELKKAYGELELRCNIKN